MIIDFIAMNIFITKTNNNWFVVALLQQLHLVNWDIISFNKPSSVNVMAIKTDMSNPSG